jgi:ubiquinone/menaquinone biosynthesis C-methylase UbiE
MTYTHGHHDSVLRSHRWRTVDNSAAYLAPHLVPGTRVLDVGCGPGTITVDIARRVAPGRVLGIDAVADVVEAARADAAAVRNLEFTTGDVYALAYDDASFDIVHAHQVLQHLSDPLAALREMKRVCKPGGIVAARDGDYASFTWYPADDALDAWRALYHEIARANGGEPDAGRFLLAWARAAGFSQIQPSASAWCFATPEDRAWWGGTWAERMTSSAIAEQAVRDGFASRRELDDMVTAWRRWSAQPDAWFAMIHGEVLCRP